jgi:hypothetical protein
MTDCYSPAFDTIRCFGYGPQRTIRTLPTENPRLKPHSHLRTGHADDRSGVSPPALFSGRKKLWVSPFATAEYTATLSRRCHHPYCSQLEKAVGGLPGDHEKHVANNLTCLCPLSRVGYRAFSRRPRQQVYRPNRSNMPQPSSHG